MLAITYHAIERARSPLCIDPDLFAEHLDRIVAAGARSLTIRGLAESLRRGEVGEPTVAITFDDAFASVLDIAVPMLEERGLTATIFCVAGHLGGRNDWPSSTSGGLLLPLVHPADAAALARRGFEIGSHGMAHAPLIDDDPALLRREVVESRRVLEDAVRAPVSSYAYPYGAGPVLAARRLVEATYDAACTTAIGRVRAGTDPFELPRVDAHYLRRPELLSRALTGSLDAYLGLRRVSARARRVLRKDYVTVAAGSTS